MQVQLPEAARSAPCEHFESGDAPEEFMLQVQGCCSSPSASGATCCCAAAACLRSASASSRTSAIQSAIVDAAAKFESRINEVVATWQSLLADDPELIPTERTIEEEMVI
jgi:hypothetical protein